MKKIFGVMSAIAVTSVSALAQEAAVDPAFTTAASDLRDTLGSYVSALLPIMAGALGLIFAFAALWQLVKILRNVLSKAG